ncbi:MAG: cytochrome d ubiquinol oxidase subunit II [Acidobacteriia bacterium]|nr:cytochrome d ubiquinol oxidase subunit II [Terriglobia bacterium]
MPTLWFCLVAVMLAGYVILDGFDIGAGIIHLFVAKNDAERRAVLASIGPVWDGNEVWLLAAGGTLYFAFPGLYASSFSGFYLALMIVLWLLILRGISIEFRNHVRSELWNTFWDAIFAGASVLLAIFYGTALGNVVRGVPIAADGYFFLALWTNLQPGPDAGIIDWYTVSIGVTALIALTIHGALWVALKTEGELQARCQAVARRFWFILLPLVLLISGTSFRIQPLLLESFDEHPWGMIFPALSASGFIGVLLFIKRQRELAAFLSSCTFILGLLCSAAMGLYPNLLPSNGDAARSLTITSVSTASYGLRIGLFWFVPAFALALTYSVFVYRHFAGKVRIQPHGH